MYILANAYSCPDLRPILAAIPGAVPATTGNSIHIGSDHIGRTTPQHYPTIAVPVGGAMSVRRVFAAVLRALRQTCSPRRTKFYGAMLLPQLQEVLRGERTHIGLDSYRWDGGVLLVVED